jgi:hypothetical protein
MVSDTGSLTRSYIVGSNVRGTSEVTRTTTGRVRVIGRTTKGLSAFTNVAGTTLTATTILSNNALTAGPFVASANPETVVSVNGTQLLGPGGAQIATVSSTPVPLMGSGSGMMITIDAGTPTLWCSSPTWRGLDFSSTLGVSLTTPTVSGSGGALLLTSGSATWAFTR